jgi:hypothetical protein
LRYLHSVLAVGFLTVAAHWAKADVVAGCNFSFEGSPDDRGSVQLLSRGGQLTMQIVQDDEVSALNPVRMAAATGDQIRAQIAKDATLKTDMGDSKVYPEDVNSSNAYTVAGAAGSKFPAAQFFAFYGADQRFLGGFGSIDADRFFCDWVSIE